MSELAQFHLLRPDWLWSLPPALVIWWLLWRQQDRLRGWSRTIAPHLLPHLLLDGESARNRIRPAHLLGGFWLLAILALAGPSWQREAAPFAEEQSVLVILLKVTPSMQAGDVQPSRHLRAVDKIGRLLERRPDTRAALVAYAGSAHRVMPFTRDHALITQFAGELSPEVMPVPGEVLAEAVAQGNALIRQSGKPGSMLLLADSVDPAQLDELKALRSQPGVPVQLWAIAAGPEVIPAAGSPSAPTLDEEQMQLAASALGGGLELISIDDSDVAAVERNLGRSMRSIGEAEGQRWRDAGYWLVPLLVGLALFWFRRGWVVRWSD
ncbi:MAG: VWA domain-containing protein [Pseudomonadota bacterium]